MAYVVLPSRGRGYTLHLDISYVGMSIDGNYTTWYFHRYIDKGSGYGAWTGYACSVDGLGGYAALGGYDFRTYSRLELGDGYFTVAHNTDGSMGGLTYSVSFAETDPDPELGNGTVYETIYPPTIPRATQPSVSPGEVDAGSSVTINLPRASGSFTHDVTYKFGNASGTIANGAGTSASWTPPLSLLNQIPNAVSGTCTITVVTKNGGSVVGTKTTTLTIKAGASIVPSIGGISHSEATTSPDVAALVGAYVQSITKLALEVTGAAGAYGSTIKTYTITVAGQAVLAASGTTGPITSSGTVPIVATVVDSRGRTAQKTVNVTVLAYSRPSISGMTVRRSLSNGTVDQNGTSYRVDATTGVSSLVVGGTQKNTLTWYIQSKPRGSGSYATQKTVTGTPPSKNGYEVPSETVLVTESRDVRLIVRDVFGASYQSYADGVLSTGGNPAFHLAADKSAAVALFATRGPGTFEAAGQMYQNDGDPVASGLRLGASGKQVTDWNDALEAGFYFSKSGAANAPVSSNWLVGVVLAVDGGGVKQIVWRAANAGGADYYDEYQRQRGGGDGSWQAWKQTRDVDGTVPVSAGGTGAKDVVAARAALGIPESVAGQVLMSLVANTTVNVTVTLPAGMFAASPSVQVTAWTGGPELIDVSAGNLATGSFQIYARRTTTVATTIMWTATERADA